VSETATILPKGPWLVTASVGALAASCHWQHHYEGLSSNIAANCGGGGYDTMIRMLRTVKQCSKTSLLWFGLNQLFGRWEGRTDRDAGPPVLGHLDHWAKLSLAVGVVVLTSFVFHRDLLGNQLVLLGNVGWCLPPKPADSTLLDFSTLFCLCAVLGSMGPSSKVQLASAGLVATILYQLTALDGFGGQLGFLALLGTYFARE
jgi:hypothetical protein